MPIPIERPLYLHFLDRELGASVGRQTPPAVADAALKCLLLGTRERLYCGLSLVWEHPAMDDPSLQALVRLIIEVDALDLVSHHETTEEFILTRRELYRHDVARYPSYFREGELEKFGPTLFKAEGTTFSLNQGLTEAIGATNRALPLLDESLRVLEQAIPRRGSEAITFTYFRRYFATPVSPAGASLRRAISELYCRHYLEYLGGDIPTGIVGLSYFDHRFGRGYPRGDVFTLSRVLRRLGLGPLLEAPVLEVERIWRGVLGEREVTAILATGIQRLLTMGGIICGGTESSIPSDRTAVWRVLRVWMSRVPLEPIALDESCIRRAAERLDNLMQHLASDASAQPFLSLAMQLEASSRADVLLVTVTDIETEELEAGIAKEFGSAPRPVLLDELQAFDYGYLGRRHVWRVRSGMGSLGPGGSTLVVFDALSHLRPKYVIMLGIAFGFEEEKQPIGRVLVATSLVSYNVIRASTSKRGRLQLELRSLRMPADVFLVEQFRAVAEEHTQFGCIVSGEALVDNPKFREQVQRLVPDAIGGEMEGSGLCAAAERRHTGWIIAKAVCDWADGNKAVDKELRQRSAAKAAVQTVLSWLAL